MNFNPHDYQDYAIRYIEKHPVAAVLLDMGLGKTIISLTAVYNLLFDSFEVHRVLVVAPLRVARDTWPAEIQKWEHLRGLTYAVAVIPLSINDCISSMPCVALLAILSSFVTFNVSPDCMTVSSLSSSGRRDFVPEKASA